MKYIAAIGLEIHAELLTKTKLFCSCENSFGREANTRCCPVCAGFPGAVGVLNKEALLLAVKAGLMIDCTVSLYSAFDRKNYFYPDLPKAYQITQQRHPICTDGHVDVCGKTIRIDNIHLEEDAGKLLHKGERTFIDYNRCSVPLIEIVTKPDITSAQEAVSFAEELSLRLRYADVCDGKMEQGSLRVDVNISVAPEGSSRMGTRVEIKNLSSFKSVRKAIEYEIKRQSEILDKGQVVVPETRRFDEDLCKTISMRSKESAPDYRYFPEPDIMPVLLKSEEIQQLKSRLPMRPEDRYKRFVRDFGLTHEEAQTIVSSPEICRYYEKVCGLCGAYKKAAALILVGLGKLFNEHGGEFDSLRFTHQELSSLALMWQEEQISAAGAMEILEMLFIHGGSCAEHARRNNLLMRFDESEAQIAIDAILAENTDAVEDYKAGRSKAFGFLMGQAVKRLGKNANPAKIKSVLEKKLQAY